MEQVFADTIRSMLDFWMDRSEMGTLVNFLAVLELAVQTAMMFYHGHEDGQGTSAPLNED